MMVVVVILLVFEILGVKFSSKVTARSWEHKGVYIDLELLIVGYPSSLFTFCSTPSYSLLFTIGTWPVYTKHRLSRIA